MGPASPAQQQQSCTELAITGQKLQTPPRAKPPPAMDIDTAELRRSSTARVLGLGFVVREGTNAQRNWESWTPKAPSLEAAIRRAAGAVGSQAEWDAVQRARDRRYAQVRGVPLRVSGGLPARGELRRDDGGGHDSVRVVRRMRR